MTGSARLPPSSEQQQGAYDHNCDEEQKHTGNSRPDSRCNLVRKKVQSTFRQQQH
jgi:hypothetical protein